MASVRLNAKDAKALQLNLESATRATRTSRPRRAPLGEYHTRCHGCSQEFRTAAEEDRHVGPGHSRFECVLDASERDRRG